MDSTNGVPYTWFEPEDEGEQSGIPTRVYNGWLKITGWKPIKTVVGDQTITRWKRQETVIKVETVRFLGSLTGEIVYPLRPKGYPLYDDLFLQGGRKECITEEEALAWLKRHGLPMPEEQEAVAAGEGSKDTENFEQETQ